VESNTGNPAKRGPTAADKPAEQLEIQSINTIRTLSMDAVQKANSGHPGTPMALAPLTYVIFDRFLRHNPKNPHWPNRDRFVLSNGHASMLLYSILHLTGYDLSLDDLKAFTQANLTTSHDALYNPAADANRNGFIGREDGQFLLRNLRPLTPKIPLKVDLTLAPEDQVHAIVELGGTGGVASVRVPTRQERGWTLPAPVAMSEIDAELRARAARLAAR
jgi:hypothetical protein